MATLQKIRNHGVLLLVIVGAAMLAFILGDFLNSGSSYFNRGREYIGSVAGNDIHYTEYEAAREQITDVYNFEYGRSDFDEDMSAQIRNQAWQIMVMDYSLKDQAQKIGMDITESELSNLLIGENPHQIMRNIRLFRDENGQFNRNALLGFYNQVFLSNDATAEMEQQLHQAKNYWLYWEKVVRLNYLQEKYTSLVQSLVRANSLDAKYAWKAGQVSKNVEYAVKPYYTVADSLVTVSNNDLKKLYNQRKQQYKQTPNRAISYVSFPILPSKEDYAAVEKAMKDIEDDFKTTDEIALVVNTNSDVLYDGRDYSITTIPERYKDFVFSNNAKEGDCTELLFADDTYYMARIVKMGYSLPDSVELKGIATEEGQEDVEIGWVKATDLPKNIAEKAFAGKRGSRFTVSQGMGEQTFEIMDVSPATPKAKVAIIERKVDASSRTSSNLYNAAKQFIVANPTEQQLVDSARAAGMTVYPQFNLQKNSDKVGQLKNSRPIVRWAFEAEEGAVSDVFDCGDQYIVATLTEVNDGEYRSFESVRAELMSEALNNKKAEYIIKELKNIESVEQAAQIMGVSVQTAENVSLNSYRFGNQGAEPKVLGAAMSLATNTVSKPIEGISGVYVIKPTSETDAAGEFDVDAEKAQLTSRNAYTLAYQIFNLIQERADIKDDRYKIQ